MHPVATDYHIPVLLAECLELLMPQATPTKSVWVDATFGGGGHSKAILARMGTDDTLVAFDQDADAEENLPDDERLQFAPTNYRYLHRELARLGHKQVDGILADLGVSSHQLDTPERGFSFRFEAPLDMRMALSDGPGKPMRLSAADVLNNYSQEQLFRVFSQYGEIPGSNRLAKAIVQTRGGKPFVTSTDLVKAVEEGLAKDNNTSLLAQAFQALRIEVNDELGALREFLLAAYSALKPGGRFVVMSYHSLEDRLVKHLFASGNLECEIPKDFYGRAQVPWQLMTKKPVVASADEVARNPRARSAKLRAAAKVVLNESKN